LKHIRKDKEPPNILQKINNPIPDDPKLTYDKTRKKRELRRALSEEQGHICCYCGQRLVIEESHIEHLRPRSTHPHLSLKYENLLVSCQGDLQAGEPRHCGKAKDDWFDQDLMVSPLWENCSEFFEYSLAGEIMATKGVGKRHSAQETIDRLSLNIPKLQAMRQAEIDPLFELDLSQEEVMKLINDMAITDAEGCYRPFCSVLIHLLKLEYSID
jgi:uncharacterized protein (TIGR02646 family)